MTRLLVAAVLIVTLVAVVTADLGATLIMAAFAAVGIWAFHAGEPIADAVFDERGDRD